MENCLSDQWQFEKVTLKNYPFLSFVMNQEKRIDIIFKNLVDFKRMSKKRRRSVKPVGARSGTLYGLCKVHKQQVYGFHPPFPSILLAPTYNLATFLFSILNFLIKNEYTIKCSFQFAEEIYEQHIIYR